MVRHARNKGAGLLKPAGRAGQLKHAQLPTSAVTSHSSMMSAAVRSAEAIALASLSSRQESRAERWQSCRRRTSALPRTQSLATRLNCTAVEQSRSTTNQHQQAGTSTAAWQDS